MLAGWFDSAILLAMISLYDILKAANGQLYGEPASQLFTNFCFDPRDAGETMLFVALRYGGRDTHGLIEDAIAQGASGIVCIGPPDCDTTGVSVLMVDDTLDALTLWAQFVIRKHNTRIIAVTGSMGVGATVDAITHVMSLKYNVLRGEVDTNNRLSLAQSVVQLSNDDDFLVLKLPLIAPGEMALMVQGLPVETTIVTHIDCYHATTFADCGQLQDELRTLLAALNADAHLILNYDDENVMRLGQQVSVNTQTISIDRFGADYMAFNVKSNAQRVGYDLRHGSERFVGQWSPLLGRENLYGLLFAIATAKHYDISIPEALNRLKDATPLAGRMRPLLGKRACTIIDDSYGAAVMSTLSALDWCKNVKSDDQRLIVILADLDDIGQYTQIGHRMVGERAADIADVLIAHGTDASLAARAALDYGMSARHVYTTFSVKDAIAILENLNLNSQDILLVKGGRSAHLEQFVTEMLANPADRAQLVRQDIENESGIVELPLRPSWVEVNPAQLASNVQTLRNMLAEDVELMAVVKANAYGHGAVMSARTAITNGATYLAVASMQEAIELREGGISEPILVLSYTPVSATRAAVRENITVTLYDLDMARTYNRMARSVGGRLKCHVKIDSGMGRLGVMPADAIEFFRHLTVLDHLDIEGIYTHFSSADEDREYTEQQIATFNKVVRPLRAAGFSFRYIHAANSAALLTIPEGHFNMVRAGLVMYGMSPNGDKLPRGIAPLMTWKTTVLQVKTLPPGHAVGYGNTYRTRTAERIAILPVGYADGLRRSPNTWRHVLVQGQRAPLIGRVSMEKIAVSVQNIPNVRIGDEVVLMGQQGNESITADDIAGWLGTINYEVVTSILPLVERRR